MEGFLLTILGDGPHGAVVPRRATLELRPGDGRLHLPAAPATDAAWRASVGAAWDAALGLTGRRDADAHLAVAATGALHGGSAGLALGLLALAALLEEPLPAFFATGAVRDAEGFLAGGAAAGAKAAAAAQLAPQLGLAGAMFLAPPLAAPPPGPGLPFARAADLGSAWARLAPASHARIAARHRALRRVEGPEGRGRFALVRRPAAASAPPLPAEAGGIALRTAPAPAAAAAAPAVAGQAEGVLLELGEAHLLRWRVALPPGAALLDEVPRCWALARECSVG